MDTPIFYNIGLSIVANRLIKMKSKKNPPKKIQKKIPPRSPSCRLSGTCSAASAT